MKIKGKQLENTLRSVANPFTEVHATQFVGGIDGAIRFKCKNAEVSAMSKGEAVYISGVSGDVPEVKLADADGAGTVPAVGLTESAANASAEVYVVSFGNLTGLNTSALNTTSPYASIVGRSVYIGTTPGQITIDKPSGSSAKLQNIGQIVREHSTEGIIKVGGAGRTAATPNLDEGKFFIGNNANQSSESTYTLPTTIGTSGQVLTSNGTNVSFADASSSAMTIESITLADTTQYLNTEYYDFSANSVNTFYIVETEANKIFRANVLVTNQTLTVGQRIKIYNKGGGTLRLYETSSNAAPNLDPAVSGGGYTAYRDVNSTALVELIATGTYKWEYVIIPQLELDESTLTQTGQVFAYNSTELAMKALPYTFPSADGNSNQILSTNGTGGLSFINQPSTVPSLEYTQLITNISAANFGGTNYLRPYYYINITNLTITLPLFTDSNAASLHGQVIKIINESGYTVGLYISETNNGSSRYTRLRDSTGELSPFSGSYTYTIPAATSIDLSIWRGSVGVNSFLFYSIIG